MRAWYDLVYAGLGPAHRVEQRYLMADDEKSPTFHDSIGDAAAVALGERERFNVYAGMARRQAALPGQKQRGRKQDCTATRVLWVEYDTKHHGGDRAVPLLRLSTFELPFSAIVWTGGGFYALLRLAELLDLTEPGLRERVEAVNRSLAQAVGDGVELDAVHDIPRILRPVGTLNHKYGTPRLVEAMRLEPERVYTLEEVEDWLGRHYPLAQPQPAPRTLARPRAAGPAVQANAGVDGGVTPWDDWLAHAPSWQELLEADGWQLHTTADDVQYWTRPHKDVRDGLSASLGYAGPDVLHVFTSSVKDLQPNSNHNRWSYEVAMRYDGDYAAAARAKAEEGYGTLGRYAKEHCGGDLSAAAKELAQQKDEAQGHRGAARLVVTTHGGLRCRRPGTARLQVVSPDGEVHAWSPR